MGGYILKKYVKTFEQASEVDMTQTQRTVFLVIDEWWKKFGFGPSIDDVMSMTGCRGRGHINRTMNRLVELGICKRVPRRARSIRPAYLKVRTLE